MSKAATVNVFVVMIDGNTDMLPTGSVHETYRAAEIAGAALARGYLAEIGEDVAEADALAARGAAEEPARTPEDFMMDYARTGHGVSLEVEELTMSADTLRALIAQLDA